MGKLLLSQIGVVMPNNESILYYSLPNLVIGFHGCSKSTFDSVIYEHDDLLVSKNSYDWLGHGIYFWENNYERA